MKKILAISMLAATMLAAAIQVKAQTFSTVSDYVVSVQDGAVTTTPVQVFLTVEDGTAVVTYYDALGDIQRIYTGKAKAEAGAYFFSGLVVTLPAGDVVRFRSAQLDPEAGVLFVAGDIQGRHDRPAVLAFKPEKA